MGAKHWVDGDSCTLSDYCFVTNEADNEVWCDYLAYLTNYASTYALSACPSGYVLACDRLLVCDSTTATSVA